MNDSSDSSDGERDFIEFYENFEEEEDSEEKTTSFSFSNPMKIITSAISHLKIPMRNELEVQQKPGVRNWLEMPPEIMNLIFTKVGPIDILLGPQFVCTAWQNLSKQPHFYRSIDLVNRDDLYYSQDEGSKNYDWDKLVKVAVDRSAGQLVEFSVKHIGFDTMFRIVTRCPLKCLRLVECGEEHELMEMAKKLPLLEELEILHYICNKSMIIAFGRFCPLLKSFRVTCRPDRFCKKSNGQAFSIARNMPGLHHLDLFGNPLSDTGLIAILDRCLHLKSLDCRQCFRLNFGEDLLKRCTDRNIDVKLPDDCCVGCGFLY